MPAADLEKLADKLHEVLESRIPGIEIQLATIGAKQDLFAEKVDSLTQAVHDHMAIHSGHDARLTALETLQTSHDKAKDRKTTVYLGIAGILATLLAAVSGWHLHLWYGGH